jgi:hypothetical protein
MKSNLPITAAALTLLAMLCAAPQARADFEVTDPLGRRILLKDDGTWRYLDPKDQDQVKAAAAEAGEAVLSLERKIGVGRTCRLELRLVNNFPYEIRSLVPAFTAFRTNGVLYEVVTAGFIGLKPGNSQRRDILFRDITCEDIARVQVGGGDRCEMGELDRFSYDRGRCLERVRVVPSDQMPFAK